MSNDQSLSAGRSERHESAKSRAENAADFEYASYPRREAYPIYLTKTRETPTALVKPPSAKRDEPTDQKTIIDSVADFVKRFVFLSDDSLYLLVASWIVATHLHKRFEYIGYLFLYSPERQSGKTTLLEILDLLVYQSSGLQVSPTEAVLFRTADGHTQLLDEVDSWKDRDYLRNVLNMGFKKGGMVTRFDKNPKAGLEARRFSVYGPRALAGIGISILPSITLDRTFALAMVRQKRSEKRERFRERTYGAAAKKLRAQIEEWVKENDELVAIVYDDSDFKYLESFSDRTIDISEPLAAIVDLVYDGSPKQAQVRESLARAIACTRREQHSPSRDHELLKHLLELTEDDDPLVGNATELAALSGNLAEPMDSHSISAVLRKYGFKTKSHRKEGEASPLYRYVLGRAELQELVDRWVQESEMGGV
jgi:putative DNA primase/helicase